jgi:hypothetical protein
MQRDREISEKIIDLAPCWIMQRPDLTPRCIMQQKALTLRCIMLRDVKLQFK